MPVPNAGPGNKEAFPAGLCGFQPYLNRVCNMADTVPRFAVTLGDHAAAFLRARPSSVKAPIGDGPIRPIDALERLNVALVEARKLRLAPGFPFAASYGDMPAAKSRGGITIVAGLFATSAGANALLRQLEAAGTQSSIVELGSVEDVFGCEGGDFERCEAARFSAVEVIAESPAFETAALRAILDRLDQSGVSSSKYDVELARAVAKLPRKCTLPSGWTSWTSHKELFRLQRKFAPAICPDGAPAVVAWRATRVESVVTLFDGEGTPTKGPRIHQVTDVACDSATLDDRPFRVELPTGPGVPAGPCPG